MSRVLAVAILVLGGCADGSTSDSGTPSETGDTGFCGGAPVVTWDNFGAGFMTENCQSCHAADAPERWGAPEEITFDTYDDTMAQGERVLLRSLASEDPMPPQGGVTSDDKVKLEYWLVCHEGLSDPAAPGR